MGPLPFILFGARRVLRLPDVKPPYQTCRAFNKARLFLATPFPLFPPLVLLLLMMSDDVVGDLAGDFLYWHASAHGVFQVKPAQNLWMRLHASSR